MYSTNEDVIMIDGKKGEAPIIDQKNLKKGGRREISIPVRDMFKGRPFFKNEYPDEEKYKLTPLEVLRERSAKRREEKEFKDALTRKMDEKIALEIEQDEFNKVIR